MLNGKLETGDGKRIPITNKRQMYALLSSGALGNTIPIYNSLNQWQHSPDYARYPQWGVRVLIPGDRRMRLYVPRGEVVEYIQTNFPDGNGFNISPMIDQWAVFKGEVFELDYPPFGLCLYANDKGNMPWREALRDYGKTWYGLQARQLLQAHMDPAIYEDVCELLHLYPGHVVEFSCCDRPVGLVPGRNTVIWEVRRY